MYPLFSSHTLVVFLLVLFVYLMIEFNVMSRWQASFEKIKDPMIVPLRPNQHGMVVVSVDNLDNIMDTTGLFGLTIEYPSDIVNYVFPLTWDQIQDALFACIGYGLDSSEGLSIRRGLTIGSAVYNYAIPLKFVLLDTDAARYYFRFKDRSQPRLVKEWIDSVGKIGSDAYWAYASDMERQYAITDVDAQYAAETIVPFIASLLIGLSKEKAFPDQEKLLAILINDTRINWQNITNQAKMQYLMQASICSVASVLDIKCPLHYVHITPIGVVIIRILSNTRNKRRSNLSLAVDNKS